MQTGRLFDIITIQTLSSSDSSGDITETWSTGTQCRASVRQVDGARYMSMSELVDREVYEIELWDNSWSSNIRIVLGSKTLYPIRPVMRNADGSYRGVVKIVAATKV